MEAKSGFYGEASFNSGYLYHTNSNASASAIPSGIGFELGYILQNTFKIGLLGTLLSSPSSNKSTSFVSSNPSIVDTTTRYKGGKQLLFLDFGLKGGINILERSNVTHGTLYLNSGIYIRDMAFANEGDVWVDIVHSVIPFEVEALYYYNEKLGIYYLGAFDLMETIYEFVPNTIKQSAQERTKSSVMSYGVRLGVGMSYKVSKEKRFFTRLILSYIYAPQSPTQQILTPSRTPDSNPSILGDVRANVFYPSNNTLGINLKIGFGF
ncbi:hypothetical protein ACRE1S_00655 [Helicobacter himalayensis]|uniref:hypothetical protein n=1 Tax=Helicobacter himalayensis TaxID=1591088 RepID=UPI003D6EEEAB